MVAELAEEIAIRAAVGSRPMLTANGDIFLRKSLISLPRFLPYQAYEAHFK